MMEGWREMEASWYDVAWVRRRGRGREGQESVCLGVCGHAGSGYHNKRHALNAYTLHPPRYTSQHHIPRYCLQPPGDTLTRRALFDCLLAGTIPVVFDYTTLEALPFQQQVPWHDMIITLSPKGIEDGSEHVVELLHSMHSTERAMQRLAVIHQYRHVLQYSLAPVHGMITYEGAWVLGAQDDAYTAGWKALVRRMCEHQRLPHHKCCRSQGYRAVTDRPC